MRIAVIILIFAVIGCDRAHESETESAPPSETPVALENVFASHPGLETVWRYQDPKTFGRHPDPWSRAPDPWNPVPESPVPSEPIPKMESNGIVFTPGSTNSKIHEYLAGKTPAKRNTAVSNTVKFQNFKRRSAHPKYLNKIANATRAGTSLTDRKRAAMSQVDPRPRSRLNPEQPVDPIGLTKHGKELLRKNGFAIIPQEGQSFLTGYEFVFINDLPVFITADAIMHAVYRSYDEIVTEIETQSIKPRLRRLLDNMHDGIGSTELQAFDEQTLRDADFYLTMAKSLLSRQPGRYDPFEPLFPENAERIQRYWEYIAEQRLRRVYLFGKRRTIDFSRFEPSARYERRPGHWRALMWLGIIDLRMTETFVGRRYNQRQANVVFALTALMEQHEADYRSLEQTLTRLVGESDNMRLAHLKKLREVLGASSWYELSKTPVDELAATIDQLGFGVQKIRGDLEFVPDGKERNTAAPVSFAVFGTRAVPDSEIFSRATHDRLGLRFMADPTDVALALFNNEAAVDHLQANGGDADRLRWMLDTFRVHNNATPTSAWQTTIYRSWIDVLRGLSTTTANINQRPSVARTKAWSTRTMNTQLASWAELRNIHELYVKMSVGNGMGCEFPTAFVEPAPQFWKALTRLADQFNQFPDDGVNDETKKRIEAYAANLKEVAQNLGAISERQAKGKSLTRRQLKYINRSIIDTRKVGYGQAWFESPGWLRSLYYQSEHAEKQSPVETPVHYDAHNKKFLKVGTAEPDWIVVDVDGVAHLGLVSKFVGANERSASLYVPAWMDPFVQEE